MADEEEAGTGWIYGLKKIKKNKLETLLARSPSENICAKYSRKRPKREGDFWGDFRISLEGEEVGLISFRDIQPEEQAAVGIGLTIDVEQELDLLIVGGPGRYPPGINFRHGPGEGPLDGLSRGEVKGRALGDELVPVGTPVALLPG